MGAELTTAATQGQRPDGLAGFFEGLVEAATVSRVRTVLLLTVMGLCAFLPGLFSIPPIDRDEARYAQATKQMMETGDYIDIRFQNQPRYLQPAGIYWLHVAAARLTGTGVNAPIWVHRLPSVAGATLAVLLTYWVALTVAGETAAFVAAFFMAASVLLGFEARDGKIDAVLLTTILGAMGFLARAYLGQPLTRAQAALFWVALAAGIMLKGPLILLVVGLTALTLSLLDRSADVVAGAAAVAGLRTHVAAGPALVGGHRPAQRWRVFHHRAGSEHARQSRVRSAESRPATGNLSVVLLVYILASGRCSRSRRRLGFGGIGAIAQSVSASPGSCRRGSCSSSS